MLTADEVDERLTLIRIAYDPESPFYGLVDVRSSLMGLPLEDQLQVHAAMSEELKRMAFRGPHPTSSWEGP